MAIYIYYTGLLNAVGRSVHLHGPSRLLVVNYFLIMTESHVFCINICVTYQPQRPTSKSLADYFPADQH